VLGARAACGKVDIGSVRNPESVEVAKSVEHHAIFTDAAMVETNSATGFDSRARSRR